MNDLHKESRMEQLEAFFERVGARRVEIKNGVVEWDGQQFFDVSLEIYSRGIAFLSEGENAKGEKYPALSCFNESGVHIAIVREILPRGRLPRMFSRLWKLIKEL